MLEDSQEKGIDVGIAVDMVCGAFKNDYDVCLLISEDADYVPAIKTIRSLGKVVELGVLYSQTRRKGHHLIQAVNWTHYIQPAALQWIKP